MIGRRFPEDTIRAPREASGVELHAHTTASDGTLTPEQLIDSAAESGIDLLAITDHDTLSGYDAVRGKAGSLQLVPAVELSLHVAGDDVHVLAYGFDPDDAALRQFLSGYVDARRDRALAMCARLRDHGFALDLDALGAQGVITRPHIARVMIANGWVEDWASAFDRYLGDDAPCHVPIRPRDASKAMRLVEAAGGYAVLAHPGHWTAHRTVLALIHAGLHGIEVCHPSHDESLERYYLDLAASHNLLAFGGSDFHGSREVEADRLGRYSPPEPHLQALRERLRQS